MTKANLTCPHCGKQQEVQMPEGKACLAMHKCEFCGQVITPQKHCCVVCDYSEQACPVTTKH